MIDESDLEIHTYWDRSPHPLWCAVKVTHIPTGLYEICDDTKHGLTNRAKAIERLAERLINEDSASGS